MGRVLKQGVWQASSLKTGDTPSFRLTLGYLELNLAVIGSRRAISECGETGVRRAQAGPGVPVGRRNVVRGSGWALAIPMCGAGRVVG